jgi:UDP-N-acetyl-D-mannosaminuronic acid dehydrogenase
VPLPSPGVGGACLEKDPFIFLESARSKNYEPLLARSPRRISDLMVSFVAENILDFLRKKAAAVKNPKVLILGFAFKGKPATSDVRGSTAVSLVHLLKKEIKNVHVFDPVAHRSDVVKHGVKYVADIQRGYDKADAVVVMNNNPVFEGLNIRSLLSLTNKPCFLFDTWGLYDKAEVEKVRGIQYKRL